MYFLVSNWDLKLIDKTKRAPNKVGGTRGFHRQMVGRHVFENNVSGISKNLFNMFGGAENTIKCPVAAISSPIDSAW